MAGGASTSGTSPGGRGLFVHHRCTRRSLSVELLADPALREDDVEAVLECLTRRRRSTHTLVDGDRSVVIRSHGSGIHDGIKIKGAGLRGSAIRMGKLHTKPYPLPRYDFEGAATIDAAKDHGRAYAGGMSYQQACHEYTVSRHLCERGMRVLPPLGYGVVRRGSHASWFCLIDTPYGSHPEWWQLTRERSDVVRVAAAFAATQLELAGHDVFLALSGMIDIDGELVRKDFHTAHIAGPNDSFLTTLAYFLFDVNFLLAGFTLDEYLPNIADHRKLAQVVYIGGLVGRDVAPEQVVRLKSLLVECKYAQWPMEERLERLAADDIARELLDASLERSGQKRLFEPPAAGHST